MSDHSTIARRIDGRKLGRSSEGTSPIVVLLASAAIGFLFVLASKSHREPHRGSASHRTSDNTLPAPSSSYPDGLGNAPRSGGESTSLFGGDPFLDNDATEWDRPALPATAMKGPQKQGWGETRAKSDGSFPSDGSHLVDQGSENTLYDRSQGGGSFTTDPTLPNVGAPTIGSTGQFRNDEARVQTDKTRIVE